MLHLILGRAGSGKTVRLFEEAEKLHEEHPEKAILLLVPDQMSLQMEREALKRLSNRSGEYLEVLSFSRLSHRVFEKEGGGAGIYLDESAKHLLMSLAVKDVKDSLLAYSKVSRQPEFTEKMVNMVAELKSYCVDLSELKRAGENMPEPLFNKINDIIKIFMAYENRLKGSYKDPLDDLERLFIKLEASDYPDDKIILIDGFWGFTPQEFNILKLFMRRCDIHITLPMDSPLKDGKDSIFRPVKNTYLKLTRYCFEEKIEIKESLCEKQKRLNAPLQRLERYLSGGAAEGEGGEAISVMESGEPFSEVTWAAREILRLTEKGYSFSDITVITHDLKNYGDIIDVVFSKYKIPVFFDRRVDISTKPAILFILCALQTIHKNFYGDSLLRLLKTGFLRMSFDEVSKLQNYVSLWDIKGAKWLKPFEGHPDGFFTEDTDESSARLSKLEELRERAVSPILRLKESLKNANTVFKKAAAIYEFLEMIDLPSQLKAKALQFEREGELSLSQEYEKVWDALMRTFDQMVAILGDEEMSLEEFENTLKTLLQGVKIGLIPNALEQVTVGTAEKIRPEEARCVIMLGVVEGAFPALGEDGGLLSDMEKSELRESGINLSPLAIDSIFEEDFMFYSALFAASEKVMLFYPRCDLQGAEQYPSAWIENICAAFLDVTIKKEEDISLKDRLLSSAQVLEETAALKQKAAHGLKADERAFLKQIEKCGAFKEELLKIETAASLKRGAALRESLDRKSIFGSASRIESFYSCRFSHFMRYMLKAKPKKKASISQVEIGVFVHAVLERFFIRLSKMELSIMEIDMEKEGAALLRRVIEEVVLENFKGIETGTSKYRYIFSRLEKSLRMTISHLRKEFSGSSFKPHFFELGIGGEGDEIKAFTVNEGSGLTVKITGKVDRIDSFKKDGKLYIKVVDYKTGGKQFSFTDIENGLNLQLLIYLFALLAGGEELFKNPLMPAGILYFHVHEPVVNAKKSDTKERTDALLEREFRMKGLLVSDADVICAMEQKEEAGRFLPVKVKGDEYVGESLVSNGELQILKGHIERMISKMAEDIAGGDISIDPFKMSGKTPCEYCGFRAACLFDEEAGSGAYREIKAVGRSEFFAGKGDLKK